MFRGLAVNIKIKGREAGSGCIYQPSASEHTYVITAKHCLIGKEKIEPSIEDILIQRDADIGMSHYLKVISFHLYPNDDHDFAIVIVEKISEVQSIMIAGPKRGNNVVFYGYPHIYRDDQEKGTALNATINLVHNSTKFEIQTNPSLFTFTNEAIDNVAGFSGSGIYYEFEKHIVLTGIIVRLRDTGGSFNLIIAENMETISKFVETILSCELVPYLLSSFDLYVKSTFEKYGAAALTFFNSFYKNGIKELTPFFILQSLKGKLFIPPLMEDLTAVNLQERDLWMGWSKILTFMHISAQEIINLETSVKYLYLGQEAASSQEQVEDTSMIRMLYTFQFRTISDCIKHIFLNEEMYRTIKMNDNVVINSSDSFTTKIVSKDLMKRILSNIDQVELYERRININDPNIYKNINVFHLEAFDNKFGVEGIEFCHIHELEQIIQSSINEVLKHDY
ncbi:ABC-three component system protein [Paenibacillus lupini]|uniref:ABC-three component system protein n=1 Tax=Paenibacillus lupini TaxID=1450204 RepID=UPI0014225807|nr:ABC-three component system protein [Paenibacillus lupini]NIK24981.1 hypothetical protein [Paenibacillus lupini]